MPEKEGMCMAFTVSGNIRVLLRITNLDGPLEGRSKQAHEKLVRMGSSALPSLRAENQRLIAQHQNHLNWLRLPENLPIRLSETGQLRRLIIEAKQSRVAAVIKEIEADCEST
jgi:hypothetical protein